MLVFHDHVSRWQFGLICIIAAADGADMGMLGACFRAFEKELHIGPMLLSTMVLAQTLAFGLTAPLWGLLCDNGVLSRPQLWSLGTSGWGCVMLGLASSSHLPTIIVLRVANGCFLASFMPLLQGWVAESAPFKSSGRVFGVVLSAYKLGMVLTTAAAVAVQGRMFWVAGMGLVTGWRVLCSTIGLLGFLMSVLTWYTFGQQADDAAAVAAERERLLATDAILQGGILRFLVAAGAEMWQNVKDHWQSHTFRVIVGQGVLGATAFQANTFELMFFMYLGLSPTQLALLTSITMIPDVVAATMGGAFGDFMERQFPNHGRAYTAQICVAGIMVVIAAQYTVFPAFGPVLLPFAVCKCILPLFGGMYHPGVMKPLLAELADPRRRSSIIAWEHALEGTVAACIGAPLVGVLSELAFGYKESAEDISAMDPATRRTNLHALQMSLAVMMLVPLAVCFVINTCLHRAYSRDQAFFAESASAPRGKKVGLGLFSLSTEAKAITPNYGSTK